MQAVINFTFIKIISTLKRCVNSYALEDGVIVSMTSRFDLNSFSQLFFIYPFSDVQT